MNCPKLDGDGGGEGNRGGGNRLPPEFPVLRGGGKASGEQGNRGQGGRGKWVKYNFILGNISQKSHSTMLQDILFLQ
jgi:hypothetical protein